MSCKSDVFAETTSDYIHEIVISAIYREIGYIAGIQASRMDCKGCKIIINFKSLDIVMRNRAECQEYTFY